MKPVFQQIGRYFYDVDKRILICTTLLAGLLIFINYEYKADVYIRQQGSLLNRFTLRFIIFLIAFVVPYAIILIANNKKYKIHWPISILFLIAPALFSLKIALDIPIHFSDDQGWNKYWNNVFYWPLRLVMISIILLLIWKLSGRDQPFYGWTTRNIKWSPYLIMLVIMLPLIAAASTQPDFLAMYPKLKLITGVYTDRHIQWWHKLIFELSYGTDFVSIELFFRGFLVLAFIKWFGKDAILPMACFYCTIHFGKPLGECISSYFGGILLGVVVYHTRSIFGGLIVHLGIAWLMEIGGYIGNNYAMY